MITLARRETRMAGKRGGGGGAKMISTLASAAAAFGAKKLIFFIWKQVTGKEAPEHPEDPQVALREAIIYGIVLGATVQTARLLATRATTGRLRKSDDSEH
jgi:hypothetical protein